MSAAWVARGCAGWSWSGLRGTAAPARRAPGGSMRRAGAAAQVLIKELGHDAPAVETEILCGDLAPIVHDVSRARRAFRLGSKIDGIE